jgi:hypothetical protein
MNSMRRRATIFLWLCCICVLVGIWWNSAPVAGRAGLVVASVLFLGLFTAELVGIITTPTAGDHRNIDDGIGLEEPPAIPSASPSPSE